MKIVKIEGVRYGRLVGIKTTGVKPYSTGNVGNKRRFCLWRCDCGNEKEIALKNVRSGQVVSCGCRWEETMKAKPPSALLESNFKHRMSRTETYRTWTSMKARCNNPGSPNYPAYGAVGIRVCDRWDRFDSFLEDMGVRPRGTTLDRIDGSKGYCPENCRWATVDVQIKNRKITRYFKHEGRLKTCREIANETGVNAYTLLSRLKIGWTIDRAISQPVVNRRRINQRKRLSVGQLLCEESFATRTKARSVAMKKFGYYARKSGWIVTKDHNEGWRIYARPDFKSE